MLIMAGDRCTYRSALGAWDTHVAEANFSYPADAGTIAILCPYLDGGLGSRDELDSFEMFEREAWALADRVSAEGRKPDVGIRAEPADFQRVFMDPAISDVIVIGHGGLSSVEVPNPDGGDRLDWKDLAKAADHLKTGSFTQRICGRTPREFNAPLGLMVVNNHRNVLAAVGRRINPVDLDDPQNELIQPVTTHTRMTYQDIKDVSKTRTTPDR